MRPLNFLVSKVNYSMDLINAQIKDYKIQETILISGTRRSGTTWLMEILETIPSYRSIFEPFHPEWYPEFGRLGIPYDPYVPTQKDLPKLREYLYKVLTGRVGSQVPFRHYIRLAEVIRRFKSSKLIVKFVRANTMLPWIANEFDVRGVYFIIRHPCATIASQLSTGYFPRITIDQLITEVNRVPELAGDRELISHLRSITSEIERLAAIWAFENYIPLASQKPHPWYTVVYERLVLRPREELEKIFGHIHEEIPEGALMKFKTPSRVTSKTYGKDQIGTVKQLTKWRKKLSERQIKAILKVTNWFGLDFYTENPEPDYDTLMKWEPSF